MHLLRTQPGGFVSDDNIADLGQTPAELVILCSGDSSLALLAEAARQLPENYPSLRLANPMQVQNHASVDLYFDQVLQHARVILLSLHGGIGYWRYGIERLVQLAERGVTLILVPGDDRPDPELSDLSTVPAEEGQRLWHFLRQGGMGNALDLYRCLANGWLARRLAGRSTGGGAAVLSLAPAGGQYRLCRCVLPALVGGGAQPLADRRGQSQGARLPERGRGPAGRSGGLDHPQHHRLCPVQPRGSAPA